MVDINPGNDIATYAPRSTNLVDAVAEVKRIADQQMRSNPLKDARIDGGLTLWLGNYGGSLVWIGDITPADQNLLDPLGNPRRQRGFVLQRDDPNRNFAITMYDPFPLPGVPLRQRMYMSDADGKRVFAEGFSGGRAFPDAPIVLYQRESFENPAATWTSDRTVFSGEGHLTGRRLQFTGAYTVSDGASNISNYFRVSGGGVTITTATTNVLNSQNVSYDLDVSTIFAVSDYINVEWHMWRTSGGASFLPRIYRCRTFSNLSSA